MTPEQSAAVARLRRALGNIIPGNEESIPNDIGHLLAALDEAQQDAARYRWLRSRVPGGTYRIMGVIYSEGGCGVDAAIDAARAGDAA